MHPEDIPDNPKDILGDHLRDEMIDREMEERRANRTPTPETDQSWASWPYAGPGISVHVGRDLERRLTLARAALKNILFIRPTSLPPVDLDEARSIANKALTQTAPKR